MELVIITVLVLSLVVIILKLVKKIKEYNQLFSMYKDIIDLDDYKEKVKKETDQMITDRNNIISGLDSQISNLRSDYSSKRTFFEKLVSEIALYEDQQEMISYGLYKPHFDFDKSEKYKNALLATREKSKELIKSGNAAISGYQDAWTVNGSLVEGRKQLKHYIKLVLRAFNGECDTLISDVRWNNIHKMEERLEKAYEAINKLGETHLITITEDYFRLKRDELRLTYEYQEKLHSEKEEQRRIQEQMREDERAQREIEKALKESEEDEKRYKKALEQAKKEMENATGKELTKLQERILQLEKEQEESLNRKERALSMAQQTKKGNVYIISNIGSFGENVFKIGMTRRLEPEDRVKELSDASVPFSFDIHAMIPSDNAPELENILHKELDFYKVNLVNDRKEFFNVPIDEIERIAKKYAPDKEIIKMVEAREYRESIAIRKSRYKIENNDKKSMILDQVPVSI